MTPQEAEQARMAQASGIKIMPEATIDPSQWIDTPYGRVHPSYQIHRTYPVNQRDHEALEKAYWESHYSTMVVGLNDKANAAMTRVAQDQKEVVGGFGPKRTHVTPTLSTGAKLPPAPRGAGTWGGWVTVESTPKN